MARRAKRRKLDKEKDSRKKARHRARRRQNAKEQAIVGMNIPSISTVYSPVVMPVRINELLPAAASSSNNGDQHNAFSSDFSDNDDFAEVIYNGRLHRNPDPRGRTTSTAPSSAAVDDTVANPPVQIRDDAPLVQPQPPPAEINSNVVTAPETTRIAVASNAAPQILSIPPADMDNAKVADEIDESVLLEAADDIAGPNNDEIAPQDDAVPLDASGNPRDPNALYTEDGIKILPPKKKDNNRTVRTRLLWILYHKRHLRSRFKERRRSINTSIDACLRGFKNSAERGSVVSVLGEHSQGLGILRPRLSKFLVYALEACETSEEYTVLFNALDDKNFYGRLMLRLSGRNIPVLPNGGFNAMINSYIVQFPLIMEEQRLVEGLFTVIVWYAGREYFESFRQNIILNYDGRFVRMIFDYFRPWLMTIVRKRGVWAIARKVYRLFRDSNDVSTICPGVNTILQQAGVLNNAYRLLLSGASVLRFYSVCNGIPSENLLYVPSLQTWS